MFMSIVGQLGSGPVNPSHLGVIRGDFFSMIHIIDNSSNDDIPDSPLTIAHRCFPFYSQLTNIK
jgi:hypothetical protein